MPLWVVDGQLPSALWRFKDFEVLRCLRFDYFWPQIPLLGSSPVERGVAVCSGALSRSWKSHSCVSLSFRVYDLIPATSAWPSLFMGESGSLQLSTYGSTLMYATSFISDLSQCNSSGRATRRSHACGQLYGLRHLSGRTDLSSEAVKGDVDGKSEEKWHAIF